VAHAFEDYVYQHAARALESVPADAAADVYVVSLLVYDEDDDPRRPTITVGYNTRTRVGETAGDAEDLDEARWNFAFWLQNELAVVAESDQDPEGARLRRDWIDSIGAWYSDEEEDEDFDATEERAVRITEEFVELAVRVVQRLHDEGVVERTFGRPLPTLIHELEYYDEIAEQNERANPDGLAADFARWVRDLS
jgi:hypothetical protein